MKTIVVYEVFNASVRPPMQVFESSQRKAKARRRAWLEAGPGHQVWILKHTVPANRAGVCRALVTIPYRGPMSTPTE